MTSLHVALRGVKAIYATEVTVYRRVWQGSVFSSFVAPVVYLAALGFGVGTMVETIDYRGHSIDFVQFVAPGVMLMSVMFLAINEGLWPIFGSLHWHKTMHGVMATPVTVAQVIAGKVCWVATRTLFVASCFGLIGAVLGVFPSWWAVCAPLVAAAVGASFMVAAGAISASLSSAADTVMSVIHRIGTTLLMMVSGVFFPLAQLPAPLQWIGWCSPLWHGVQMARDLAVGVGPDTMWWLHGLVIVTWLVFPAWLMHRSMTKELLS